MGINNIQLAQEDKDQLVEVMYDYSDIYYTSLSLDIHTHTIDTSDNPPVHQPARQIPFTLHVKVEEMVEDTIEQSVKQPSAILGQAPKFNGSFCCLLCSVQGLVCSMEPFIHPDFIRLYKTLYSYRHTDLYKTGT